MAGLVLAIHAFLRQGQDVDARVKPGHDEKKRMTTAADMIGKRRRR
ncbi:MAG: hypothetical protein ACLPX7_18065 [Xanthobacteraceae bacterium]